MKQEVQQQRLGKITASNFAKLIKKNKDGSYFLSSSEVAKNLIYRIVWERFIINENIADALERVNVTSKSMEHGTDFEPYAVSRYEEFTGRKVDYKDQYNAFTEDIGGTPDGYIGKDGLIEIKCPYNGGNHVRTLLTGEIYNKDYWVQVQGYMMITGRKWCDFVTYDPDMPKGLDICVIRVEKDAEFIEALKGVLEEAVEIIKTSKL